MAVRTLSPDATTATVTTLNPGDWPLIQQLPEAACGPLDNTFWLRLLDATIPNLTAAGLWHASELQGLIAGQQIGNEMEIYWLWVHPDQRQQGYGQQLITFFCAASNVTWLEVRASNIAAGKLYASLGFILVNTRKRYYRHPVEDALVFSRTCPL